MKHMAKTSFKSFYLTVAVLFLGAPSVALADCYDRGDCETINCWNAAEFDKDGDGYAYVGYAYSEYIDDGFGDDFADLGDRETFTIIENDELPGWTDYGLSFFRLVRRKDRMTCPTGWVKARGDCNDNDPHIHPRQFEVPYNAIDDNCNGLQDEPSFVYNPSGNHNRSTGFDMGFTVNDQEVVDAIESPLVTVRVKITYQDLKDTSASRTQTKSIKNYYSYWGDYKYAEVALSHRTAVRPNTVYRARVQFEKRWVFDTSTYTNVGAPSDWYYTTTTGYGKVNEARNQIVLKAFHQFYESNHHSIIGYQGSHNKDGIRYGADEGENWCAEFYAWVTQSILNGKGHSQYVSDLRAYFSGKRGEILNPTNSQIQTRIKPGDFIGIATDKSDPNKATHASLFLAYDSHLDAVWTLDGNTHGFNETPDINDKKSRRASNEVSVRVRGLDFEYDELEDGTPVTTPLIKTWGKIKYNMVK
tara:strand:+ start:3987 stop:5405 length:1419 start_codon:yes stop_codon:yes gene_type:complete